MIDFDFDFEFEGSRGKPGSRWVAAFVVGALFVAGQGQGQGPPVEVVLGVDTAAVGDVVAVGLRVTVAPGERVVWPDTLPLEGLPAENATRVEERVDTLDDGRLAWTGVYGVTPWRPGELALPRVPVAVVGGSESPRELEVAVPSLVVASVLPADTAAIEPRPARGVIGASWAWGRIAALAALALVALALLVWWWRRRRADEVEPAPAEPLVPPRERALAALREARDAGLLERGELKAFYTRVTEAVRGYAAALHPAWGEDLTTSELLARLRADVGIPDAADLRAVLEPADRVKFARRTPERATVLEEWQAAHAWVRAFDGPERRRGPGGSDGRNGSDDPEASQGVESSAGAESRSGRFGPPGSRPAEEAP